MTKPVSARRTQVQSDATRGSQAHSNKERIVPSITSVQTRLYSISPIVCSADYRIIRYELVHRSLVYVNKSLCVRSTNLRIRKKRSIVQRVLTDLSSLLVRYLKRQGVTVL